MKIITENQIIDDFAIFLEIENSTLDAIKYNPDIIKNNDFMIKAVQEKGNNVHIVQLTLNNPHKITKYVDLLLDKYESVSWCNKEGRFSIKTKTLSEV